jgi:hypothetical protein
MQRKFHSAMTVLPLLALSIDAGASLVELDGETVLFSLNDRHLARIERRFDIDVVGDEIRFLPKEDRFDASVRGFDEQRTVSQRFIVTISAKDGFKLDEADVSGGGNYETELQDSETSAMISYKYGRNGPGRRDGKGTMAASFLPSETSSEDSDSGSWSSEGDFDLHGRAASRFNLTALLLAATDEQRGRARIDLQEGIRLAVNSVPTAEVPVPATIGLLLSGCGGLLRWKWKRSARRQLSA